MATRSLNVVITGDSKQLGIATDRAGRQIGDLESRGNRMGKALAASFATAGVAAAGVLAIGLKKSVDAAVEAEKSQARLTAQLKASDISYAAHARQIEEVIQKHSRLAGIDDEELQDAFTNIIRTTGDVDKSLRLVGLAADFARAKQMDASKAGEIIAKVAGGNVGILSRYGFQIEKGASATEALGAMQEKFAGQARAYGRTAAGAQDRFRVATENLQEALGEKLLPTLTRVTNRVNTFVEGLEDGKGAGGSFADAMREGDGALRGHGKALSGVVDALDPYVDAARDAVTWTRRHKVAMDALDVAIVTPTENLERLAGLLRGISAAAKGVKDSVTGLFGPLKNLGDDSKFFGDGIGDVASNIRSIPNFGGGLMGARPSMAPVAGAASRFGLRVSSGLRPGSITSSGNRSYHSTGEALDVAGTPAGMKGFFNYMKNTAGSRLAELIYTPGGTGVRNGAPHTYSGKVAADHFDHVHVAVDSGAPGVGDGLGKFHSTAYGPPWDAMNGTGVTRTGVNLKGAPKVYGVAVDPSVIPLGSKLKIWPNPFGYRGTFTAFDTGGAIKGKDIDFYDWRGRGSQLDWGNRSVNVELVTGAGSRRRHGSSGSAPRPSHPGLVAGMTPGHSGGVFIDGNRVTEAQWRSGALLNALAPGHDFGGGDLDPAEIDPGPTIDDYALSRVAHARLTPGTEDDLSALQNLAQLRKTQMDAALSNADPRDDADAIDAWISATEAVKQLTESIDQAAEAQRQRDAVNEQIANQQKQILALANQGPQIVAAVVAAVSGGIGGQLGLGYQTPGYAGGVANYAGGTGRL